MITATRSPFLFFAAFFFANILLSSYYIDIWPNANAVSRALPVLTFSQNRTLQIDEYAERTMDKGKIGEHYYSEKAPLPTILMIPVYELMKRFGLEHVSEKTGKGFPIHVYRLIGKEDARDMIFSEIIPILIVGCFLFGSVPFAAVLLITLYSLKKQKLHFSPVITVMFAFYGSFIFIYSGTFYSHIFAGFLLLSSYVLLKNGHYAKSGLLLGLGVLTEYPVFVAAPIWILLIALKTQHYKYSLKFIYGLTPSIVAILIYNWRITGNPLTALNAYHAHDVYRELSNFYGLSLPTQTSLWGLAFSGSMGLFLFVPVLLMIAFPLLKKIVTERNVLKQAIEKMKTHYLTYFAIAYYCAIASFFTWWGGWGYGPRYLVVLAILLVYEELPFISKHKFIRWVFVLITGCGVLCTWLAKSTLSYMIPDGYITENPFTNTFINFILPEVIAGRFNSSNVPSLLLNIHPMLSGLIWIIFFLVLAIGFAVWEKSIFRGRQMANNMASFVDG